GGQFSDGQNMVLGEIATATFANPAGMVRVGDSSFSSSIASGVPLVGVPGVGSRGSLTAGSLEMSNVDLAQEFTNMIIAERGFQANSNVITTSDAMLNDLVSINRKSPALRPQSALTRPTGTVPLRPRSYIRTRLHGRTRQP